MILRDWTGKIGLRELVFSPSMYVDHSVSL